jgi:hypothetical protein
MADEFIHHQELAIEGRMVRQQVSELGEAPIHVHRLG